MRIVHQSASNSYSQPPEALLIAPPKVAGLLPARTPIKVEIVQHQTHRQETSKSASPRVYRTFAEWRAADEELRLHFERSHPTLRNLYQRVYEEAANG